jgi:hypothetical protein
MASIKTEVEEAVTEGEVPHKTKFTVDGSRQKRKKRYRGRGKRLRFTVDGFSLERRG